ncbi:MAG: response regulator [Pseudomonadota bacterium]|nr:response regulator [Pseudomonadota bacterium]
MTEPSDTPPSRTLLLVDDEQNILSALQRALRRDGYRILASDDPRKALDILANERVDVILSDQRMPGLSGVEFQRLARALQSANVELQAHIAEKERQARQIATVLDTLQEVLQLIPWPLIGVDEEGLVALSNTAADASLGGGAPLLGQEAREMLPEAMRAWLSNPASIPEQTAHEGRRYRVVYKPMGLHSRSRGTLLALLPCEMCP